MNDFRAFPGKILLFGEYTILQGSKALAIPMEGELGKFAQGNDPRIEAYFNWLIEQDLPLKKKELKKHADKLIFDSTIPIGYGAGSSGALVAATFDAFSEKDELPGIEVLGAMEGFFHGNSSGLDPLVSFYKKAHIFEDGKATPFDYDEMNLPEYELYDSTQTRSTSKLVKLFHQKLLKRNFVDSTEYMTEITNQIITSLSKNEYVELDKIERLSILQREWMADFIPLRVKEDWDDALEQGDRVFKLCGAGGGGFFLEFYPEED